jgi:hypothetical protein
MPDWQHLKNIISADNLYQYLRQLSVNTCFLVRTRGFGILLPVLCANNSVFKRLISSDTPCFEAIQAIMLACRLPWEKSPRHSWGPGKLFSSKVNL